MLCPYSTFSFKETESKSDTQYSHKVVEEQEIVPEMTLEVIQVRDTTSPGLRDGDGPRAPCDIEWAFATRIITEFCHL